MKPVRALCLAALALTLWTLCPTPRAWPQAQGAPAVPPPATADQRDLAIPPALEEWTGWVLHGLERYQCPTQLNDPGSLVCAYPGQLSLDAASGEFTQRWVLFADQAVQLPYVPDGAGAVVWPGQVMVDGQAAPVVDQGGAPAVQLTRGSHVLRGVLAWERTPESVQIPPETALVELTENGLPLPLTELSAQGLLRLAPPAAEERAEDRFEARIFRLLRDSRPSEITTLVRLYVSGRDRSLLLENVLPENSTPMSVESPLNLQFQPGRAISVQARAGSFDIFVTSRLNERVSALGPLDTPFGPEFWSFQAEQELRVAEVRGVPAVDPQTTDIPEQWKHLPAYLVENGATLGLEELHRGGLTQAPDMLNIQRTLWLDFDGRGLTAQDTIQGEVRQEWTLTMSPPANLGRASLDGADQPVVLLGEADLPGVELRNGYVSLVAESRYEDFTSSLPCGGWDRDFQSVSASLNLPPGWRLLAATGADAVNQSWISRWDLLDIFLALIISLAVFRLKGPFFGVMTLIFFVLGLHEPGAPRYSWLFLLGSLTLVHLFAASERFRRWLWVKRSLLGAYLFFLVIMALIALPFIFNQFRSGIYPQLEALYPSYGMYDRVSTVQYDVAPAPMSAPGTGGGMRSEGFAAESTSPEAWDEPSDGERTGYDKSGVFSSLENQAQFTYDPEALVQTGPGLPNWSWRSVTLTWNGPVERDQSLSLWLLPPWANMLLSFARAILLLAVLAALADIRKHLAVMKRPVATAAAALTLLALTPLLLLAPGSARAQTGAYPPPEILQQLQQRLLEPDSCFPDCVAAPEFELSLEQGQLRMVLAVHAATRTSVPLPTVSENWQPTQVLLDENPTLELYRRDQSLWLLVPEGVHRVVLLGPAPQGDVLQVSLPLLPKNGRVTAPGWNVQGLGQNGQLEGSLRLSRVVDTPVENQTQGTQTVPPFLHVERRIQLGLQWECVTTVSRLTPLGEPVLTEVPLLPGESVLSQGMEVADGKVLARLEGGENSLSWRSSLAQTPNIELVAPENVAWVETWVIEAAPIWDVTLSGIPMARNLDDYGAWQPLWRPWPGESVTIAAARPQAAPGETMTIDSADYALTPGSRLDDNTLTLSIRSAKGGRYTLTLPPDADVQQFTLDGRELPRIGQTPGALDVTLAPGVQSLYVSWRQSRSSLLSVSAPAMDLGHAAVNVHLTYDLPENRWPLFIWGGPDMGPAVRFWTYLAAMVLVAAVLGSIPYTPLRRWQWFLLALGLSQVGPMLALFTVGWLFALGAKRKHYLRQGWVWYDLIQVGLWVLALIGLGCLAAAVTRGLLDPPGMQIAGNGSSDTWLYWTQDRIAGMLPRPTIVSLPIIWYRAVMLLWSLWLAFALLRWLKWGWESLIEGGFMRGPATARQLRGDDVAQAEEGSPAGEREDSGS